MTATPFKGLSLSASGTFVDSKVQRYSGFDATGVFQDFAGSPFPFTPRWQLVGDGEYRWPVSGTLDAFAGSGVSWRSNAQSVLGEAAAFRLKSYALVDLRLGIGRADRRWQFAVYGENVTNSYYFTNRFELAGARVRTAGRPATYGGRLSVQF